MNMGGLSLTSTTFMATVVLAVRASGLPLSLLKIVKLYDRSNS